MFLSRIIARCLKKSIFSHCLNNSKTFCVIYDKNFDYFRNKTEYKNSVVQLNNDLNQSRVAGPGFSFLLKEHNIQTEGYFSHLTQRENVMKLSATQVKDLLFLMANIKIDSSKYGTTLKYLDEKCAVSVERWPLDLSFYILDAWFIIWGPKTFKKHYYCAISNLWGRRIHKCSKFNLILMLYFIGMSKVSPPFLMEAIEDRMESFISDFSDEELAVACLSFFKLSKRINSDLLLKQSCIAATNLLLKNDRFNVISILKSLRLSNYYDEKLWEIIKDYTVKEINTYNFVECTNFLAMFATQNIYNEILFDSLETQGLAVLQNEENLSKVGKQEFNAKTHPSLRSRVKDIARYMWALSSMGHSIKDNTLSFVCGIIKQRMDDSEFESQMHVLIDCLQSLSLVGCYPHDILSSVLTTSTLNNLYNSDRAKPKYQLYFVQRSTQIEPKLQINMRSIFNPIPKSLEKDIKNRKGLRDLINILNNTSIKNFKCCFLIPHIMISGIIVGFEPDSAVSSKESSEKDLNIFKRYIDEGIISHQASDIFRGNRDYICIEILDPSVCVSGTIMPLGLMKTKIRQLNKLNFKTVTLSTAQINDMMQKRLPRNCKSIKELIVF